MKKICLMKNSLWVLMTVLLAVFLNSCGSGGGGGGGGKKPPASPVSVSGNITFDFVPATQSSGLDYSNISQKPSRGVIVEAIKSADSSMLDSITTDSSGNYAVTVPANTDVFIRVKAHMLKSGTPSWNFKVVDNTNSKSLYVMDSASFNSGTANISNKNLNASSGWGGSSYTSTRASAVFAILDTIYQAIQKVTTADTTIEMPQLLVNWSINNVPIDGDKTLGQIGTSHYDRDEKELYILGSEDNDTDEYDDHVIAHEWAHYFDDRFSRSDSVGGPHGGGDKLDPRVAFGEGFGNAFSGMATDNPYYIDTSGTLQATTGVFMNLEDNGYDESAEGWFSEASVQVILYDLYDSAIDGVDQIASGFIPIYNVMVNNQKNADSFTTIYSFISFFKENNPTVVTVVNDLMAGENISSSAVDEWDSTGTETNNGGNPKSLPVYKQLTVGSPVVQLCGNGQFGNYNKLMNRRFFYFYITSTGSYSITADPDVNGDPVIELYSQGELIAYEDSGFDGDSETLTETLSPGYYVGEVYEWWHVYSDYTTQECFDMTFN